MPKLIKRNEELLKTIGEAIRTQRILRGMTQVDLAKLSGCCPSHISRIEKGMDDVSICYLYSTLNALGLDLKVVRK